LKGANCKICKKKGGITNAKMNKNRELIIKQAEIKKKRLIQQTKAINKRGIKVRLTEKD
jgi:hypothetical protein